MTLDSAAGVLAPPALLRTMWKCGCDADPRTTIEPHTGTEDKMGHGELSVFEVDPAAESWKERSQK